MRKSKPFIMRKLKLLIDVHKEAADLLQHTATNSNNCITFYALQHVLPDEIVQAVEDDIRKEGVDTQQHTATQTTR